MRLLKFAVLAASALLTTAAGKPQAAASGGNWNAAIAVTPSGSHVLGNPAAPVKVAEYISYTCPHCAHFAVESEGPLRLAYVGPGKVSVEVRHLVRDPIDMTAALLTNCGDRSRFFIRHMAFLRGQETWLARLGTMSEAQRQRWSSGDTITRMRAIAADFGFYAIMERLGYSRPATDRCLADTAMASRLVAQTAAARRDGVEGTPSFMIGDVLLAGTHDWRSLDLQLRARM